MSPSSSSSNAGFPMHKNNLQEYAQRSGLQNPCYNTVNGGFSHAPKFRSKVLVGGTTYTSSQSFSTRKEAEQDAAKLALGVIKKNMKEQTYPLVHQDPLIWKSILNEFAVKTNKEFPTYTTANQSDDKRPVFVSTMFFCGNTYTGGVSKSKKEAEQLAAQGAIYSLLESGSRNILNQIIHSKGKHYAGLTKIEDPSKQQTHVLPSSVKFKGAGSIENLNDGRKRMFEDHNSSEGRNEVIRRKP